MADGRSRLDRSIVPGRRSLPCWIGPPTHPATRPRMANLPPDIRDQRAPGPIPAMAHAFLRLGPEKDVRSARLPARRVACILTAVAILMGAVGWVEARADEGRKPADGLAPEAVEFFEMRIRPVLVERCLG